MNDLGSNSNKAMVSGGGTSRRPREIIENRLREAGLRITRSVDVANGTKRCYRTHSDPSIHKYPGLISGNYTIHGGDNLILFDIDLNDLSKLPIWLRNLPETLIVESPHAGYHLYYALEDDTEISSSNFPWGSIRYEGQYVVGPGSTIDHADCKDGKKKCPGQGTGTYDFHTNKPIATLSSEYLDTIQSVCSGSHETEEFDANVLGAPDPDLVALGNESLQELRIESTPAFKAVMDFLRGGTADFNGENLTKQNGKIDRDTQESIAISLLYGTLRVIGDYDHEKAINIATAIFTQFCQEQPWTKDGQPRRWLTDSEYYQQRIINYALNSFTPEKFKFLVDKRGAGTRRDNNEYSELTYNAIWEALYEQLPSISPPMSNDMDPENPKPKARIPSGHMGVESSKWDEVYPGKQEILERAYEIDDQYNNWVTYEEAFRRLQAVYGEVKAARLGNTWVYYPADYPDPPDATYVLQYGEKFDPEVEEGINSWTGEPLESDSESKENAEREIMTDGGTPRSEVKTYDEYG